MYIDDNFDDGCDSGSFNEDEDHPTLVISTQIDR